MVMVAAPRPSAASAASATAVVCGTCSTLGRRRPLSTMNTVTEIGFGDTGAREVVVGTVSTAVGVEPQPTASAASAARKSRRNLIGAQFWQGAVYPWTCEPDRGCPP